MGERGMIVGSVAAGVGGSCFSWWHCTGSNAATHTQTYMYVHGT